VIGAIARFLSGFSFGAVIAFALGLWFLWEGRDQPRRNEMLAPRRKRSSTACGANLIKLTDSVQLQAIKTICRRWTGGSTTFKMSAASRGGHSLACQLQHVLCRMVPTLDVCLYSNLCGNE
jgi:hypothetical protein